MSAYPDRPAANPSSPQPSVFSRCSLLHNTHRPLPTFPRPAPAPTQSGFSYTYELPLPIDRFAGLLFSWSYELLSQQLLCFDNYLRCPLFFRNLRFGSRVTRLPRSSRGHSPFTAFPWLTPFLTYCCKLSVVAKKVNSFAIKQIHTLPENTRGGVCSSDPNSVFSVPSVVNRSLSSFPATHTKLSRVSPFPATHAENRGLGAVMVNLSRASARLDQGAARSVVAEALHSSGTATTHRNGFNDPQPESQTSARSEPAKSRPPLHLSARICGRR